jgi:hypothetical protein
MACSSCIVPGCSNTTSRRAAEAQRRNGGIVMLDLSSTPDEFLEPIARVVEAATRSPKSSTNVAVSPRLPDAT